MRYIIKIISHKNNQYKYRYYDKIIILFQIKSFIFNSIIYIPPHMTMLK